MQALAERFVQVHERLYQVYSVGQDRDAMHDLLSQSFAGEALTREYVEHFSTVAQMKRDQTAIDVLNVDYESVEVTRIGRRRAVVDADWSVGGVVTHQGHKHARVNRYRAIYTVAWPESTADLRIVDTRMMSLARVQTLRGGREFPLDDVPTSARGLLSAEDLLRGGLFGEVPAVEPGGDGND